MVLIIILLCSSWKVRREYDRKAKINTILKQNVPGKILFLPAQQSKKTNEENESKYQNHSYFIVNIIYYDI